MMLMMMMMMMMMTVGIGGCCLRWMNKLSLATGPAEHHQRPAAAAAAVGSRTDIGTRSNCSKSAVWDKVTKSQREVVAYPNFWRYQISLYDSVR